LISKLSSLKAKEKQIEIFDKKEGEKAKRTGTYRKQQKIKDKKSMYNQLKRMESMNVNVRKWNILYPES
jgi:hypothetical protein